MATNTSTAASSLNGPISNEMASVVANAFVNQYYLLLKNDPENLHKFYADSSHLSIPSILNGVSETVENLEGIKSKVADIQFLKDAHLEVTSVDAQGSASGSVSVFVSGNVSTKKGGKVGFSQLFRLARNEKSLFLLNDIFDFDKFPNPATSDDQQTDPSQLPQSENARVPIQTSTTESVTSVADPRSSTTVSSEKTQTRPKQMAVKSRLPKQITQKAEPPPQAPSFAPSPADTQTPTSSPAPTLISTPAPTAAQPPAAIQAPASAQPILPPAAPTTPPVSLAEVKTPAAAITTPGQGSGTEEKVKMSYASIVSTSGQKVGRPMPAVSETAARNRNPEMANAAIRNRPASSSGHKPLTPVSNSSAVSLLPPPENSHPSEGNIGAENGPTDDPRSIHIRNLPPDATKNDIAREFSQFGPVKLNGIQIRHKYQGNHVFVFGFLEFEATEPCLAAIKKGSLAMNGYTVKIEKKHGATANPGSLNGSHRAPRSGINVRSVRNTLTDKRPYLPLRSAAIHNVKEETVQKASTGEGPDSGAAVTHGNGRGRGQLLQSDGRGNGGPAGAQRFRRQSQGRSRAATVPSTGQRKDSQSLPAQALV